MSTAFSQPRTFNLPNVLIPDDPAFKNTLDIAPPEDQFNKRLTRWAYYPGDRIVAERKQERLEFTEGGEDVGSACMIRTRGFLPKGKITPIEQAFDWWATDHLVDPEKAEVMSQPVPGTNGKLTLAGVPRFPGHEIANLVGRWSNDQGIATGHVEIRGLIGVTFESGEVQKLNALFVPNGRAARTLRELKEDIERGAGSTKDQGIKDIANEMYTACTRFLNWGTRHVNKANILLTQTAIPFNYAYTSLDELILDQLEIPRQDRQVQNAAASQHALMEAVTKMAEMQSQPKTSSLEDIIEALRANPEIFQAAIAAAQRPKK